MILAVGEVEENGESFLTIEERLYRLENQVATLGDVVTKLITNVGIANSYIIIESEGGERKRMLQEAKKVAVDLGGLLHKMRQLWPL